MYKFIFYCLYKDLLRSRINTTPLMSAYFLLTIIQSFHIIIFIEIISKMIDFDIILSLSKFGVIFFSILLMVINYFLYHRKIEDILKKYDPKYGKKKVIQSLIAWSTIILSFALMLIIASSLN